MTAPTYHDVPGGIYNYIVPLEKKIHPSTIPLKNFHGYMVELFSNDTEKMDFCERLCDVIHKIAMIAASIFAYPVLGIIAGVGYLHTKQKEIPEIIAEYFDLDIELVNEVIWDCDNNIFTQDAENCYKNIIKVIEGETEDIQAILDLEQLLKSKVLQKNNISFDSYNSHSAMEFVPFEVIPLRQTLFCSKDRFYRISPDSEDYKYFKNYNNLPLLSQSAQILTENDLEAFKNKKKSLNIVDE